MIEGNDLLAAADMAAASLQRHAGQRWDAPAGDLEWTCRFTGDHITQALMFYAVQLAARATERVPRVRDPRPDAEVGDITGSLVSAATVLWRVAQEAGPSARAFHPAGMADTEGFLAMGCDEILVHTFDILAGLGAGFDPNPDLAGRVVARLFPWAPDGFGAWETLLWCNGRRPLGPHTRLGPDWYWHCAPLDEWDGTVNRRHQAAEGG